MTDDTNAARRGSGSDDLLGQIPVGVLTDGEAAMLIAWAETIAAQRVAAERERWRAAAEHAAHQLEKARIWNGMDWHYNPLHPMHYKPALDRMREVLDRA